MTHDYGSGWEKAYAEHSSDTLWSEDPIPCLDQVAEHLTAAGVRTVLDVGCGDGRNLAALLGHGFAGAGLDISGTALQRASRRLGGRAFLVRGDAVSLDAIPDGSVDAITNFDVFGQIPEAERMVGNFRRVLRPGGICAVNAYTPADSEYGMGTPVGDHAFEYRGTLFRFFEEADVRKIFDGWKLLSLGRQSWVDPPHGAFRPHEHTHDNWIVVATPEREDF
ncbi:class I SAM-dependent methyltransferase [Nonomuraea sp. NPDC049709]|uniref:class I SAM-dependent methyltransferase n=1 Tax=Nonomuraea sp. NPDC049709 TaxID=3154736 RepID=UPI0034391802